MGGWWLCPNEPRCPHGDVLHDRDDYDDPSPTCCADGCDCGRVKSGPAPVAPPQPCQPVQNLVRRESGGLPLFGR